MWTIWKAGRGNEPGRCRGGLYALPFRAGMNPAPETGHLHNRMKENVTTMSVRCVMIDKIKNKKQEVMLWPH